MEGIKKIAVLRTGGLGDFIVTLPALSAIKSACPEARLILLGEPWHKEFLREGRSPVDQVIPIPFCSNLRPGGAEDPQELDAFFRTMQQEHLDIALHFQGKGIAANRFLRNLHAGITAGNTCPEAMPADRSIPFYYYQNEIMRYLEVAGLIGANAVKPVPELKVLPGDLTEARALLTERGVHRPYIVLHPGALDARRRWPAANFAAAGDALSRKGYAVLLTGKEKNDPEVQAVLAEMKFPAQDLSGMLSLGGLTGLLSACELLISNDTGPLHLARAVGAKTTGIYWAPNFINWGPLSFGRHRPVISWEMECPLCGTIPNDPYPFEPLLPGCAHEVSFVRDITVEQVLAAAEQLLEAPGQLAGHGTTITGKTINDHADVIKNDHDLQGIAIR